MTMPDDGERTVVKRAPDAAGTNRPDALGEYPDALPASTRLHEFEILSVIGQGGFGIVYLAHDLSLDRRVAIKEYMPSALATRTQAMTVAVRSQRHTETFAAGLRSFINEARLLARFDHPSLLKVHRFWEAHGTAYMAMPYYAGITLGKQLSQATARPDEARLIALLLPLLDALELMHAAHCFHRDIAPDNILMQPDGRPLLLDFGAARHVISDMTQAPTVILKSGYAPVEQYGAMPDMTQGAWTDLYALGSVIEFAITGQTPPQAVARYLGDKREPLAARAAGRYSDAFLRAIDHSLAVLPKDRPQSAAQMRAVLLAATPRGRAASAGGGAAAPVARPAPRHTPGRPRESAREAENALTVHYNPPPLSLEASRAVLPVPSAAARADLRALALSALASLLVVAAAVGAGYAWFGARRMDGATRPAASASRGVAPPLPTTALPPAETSAPAAAVATPEPAPEASIEPAPSPPFTAAPPAQPIDPAGVATEPLHNHPAVPPRGATGAARPVPTVQRIPNTKLPNARCADIIQRTSLGEELSDADKALLTRECKP